MQQLNIKLKQHTPLINFQWEQNHSTLRPTEFKSKLDKWIIAHKTKCYLSAEERLKAALKDEQLKKWIKGAKKEHPALDYTVSIFPEGENLLATELNANIGNDGKMHDYDYKPFFGNQMKVDEFKNDEKKIKRLSFYKTIHVQIDCAYEDLKAELAKQIPRFLLHTNFGTRQSKGFGSFFLAFNDPLFPMENNKVKEDFFNSSMMYGFDVDVSKPSEPLEKECFTRLFEIIDLFYKTLRSGINPSDKYKMYFKSFMWYYAKSKTKQWDKKTMKEALLDNGTITSQQTKYADTNSPLNWNKGEKGNANYPHSNPPSAKDTHLLWRDLLGLSSLEIWKYYSKTITKKSKDKKNDKEEYTRFPSPLFFKPLRTGKNTFRIYFEVPEHIRNSFNKNPSASSEEAEILGKWFDIEGGNNPLKLPFPKSFDYKEFLDFVAGKDIRDIVKKTENRDGKLFGREIEKNNGRNWKKVPNPHYKLLCDIYDQLALQQQNKQ